MKTMMTLQIRHCHSWGHVPDFYGFRKTTVSDKLPGDQTLFGIQMVQEGSM